MIGELAAAKPLLIIAILAVLAAAAGWMMERDRPALARALRQSGYLGMLAAGLLLVGQLAWQAEKSDARLMVRTPPGLTVSGQETVVPMAPDGHFWVTAQVNGRPVEFLVDTGATYTGMGRDAAQEAGIVPDDSEIPFELDTANGVIRARMGLAREFRFGSVEAPDLQVAVPETVTDKTNVLGMNFLSRLQSWRVEGNRLILVPSPNPQSER